MLSLPSRPALKKSDHIFFALGVIDGAYNVSGFGLPVLNALRGARVAVHSKRVAESQ
jgi:hypothetical protein